MALHSGVRRRSSVRLAGLPLFDVAIGPDPLAGEERGHAKGIVAVGDRATGCVAVGGMARGGIAVGGLAAGGVAVGGVSAGLIAVGGVTVAALAVGGVALGAWAIGGAAVGLLRAVGGKEKELAPRRATRPAARIFMSVARRGTMPR